MSGTDSEDEYRPYMKNPAPLAPQTRSKALCLKGFIFIYATTKANPFSINGIFEIFRNALRIELLKNGNI